MKVIRMSYAGKTCYIGHSPSGYPPLDPAHARKFSLPADAECLLASWPKEWHERFLPEVIDYHSPEDHHAPQRTA